VFDAETDDEAVYSMQIGDDEDAHAVLAFEEEADAKRYALSLRDEPNSSTAAVQALDFEALVVTSRDAEFAVAVVFQGDIGAEPKVDEREIPLFASDAAAALSMSVTMVPEEVFAGKSASDYVDPAEDPIWVLVHDAGTADAQYFSMMLNGSDSIVCFRDEDSASRCGDALRGTGALRAPETQEVLLEDLLTSIAEECDVCLVDEVVETLIDAAESDADTRPSIVASDDDDTVVGCARSSATPSSVIDALQRLFDGADAAGSDAEQPAEVDLKVVDERTDERGEEFGGPGRR